MKNLKEKKGISLIVLIITIIIMIILAAAIILSLNNSGIIGKASKATFDTNKSKIIERINLAMASLQLKYTGNVSQITVDELQKELGKEYIVLEGAMFNILYNKSLYRCDEELNVTYLGEYENETTTKSGTEIVLDQFGIYNAKLTYEDEEDITILGTNRLNIQDYKFSMNSYNSKYTITKENNGIVIVSQDFSEVVNSAFTTIDMYAEVSGKVWVSCDADCTGNISDIGLNVRVNDVAQQLCRGKGKLSESVEVQKGDKITLVFYSHIGTSAANTVSYKNIMVQYGQLTDFVEYIEPISTLKNIKKTIVLNGSEGSSSYTAGSTSNGGTDYRFTYNNIITDANNNILPTSNDKTANVTVNGINLKTYNETYNSNIGVGISNSGKISIYLGNGYDRNNLIEYLQSNPITITYDSSDTEFVGIDEDVVKLSTGNIIKSANEISIKYSYLKNINESKIVFFGDSITGMFQNETDYPSLISRKIGAETYNVGFSGTTFTDHPTSAKHVPFCMNRLTDAICSGDFSTQEENVTSCGELYVKRLNVLRTIDFSTIDYVVIFYGANDWGYGRVLKSSDDTSITNKQRTNVEDSIEYCVNKLKKQYPNLKIIVISPYWRLLDGNYCDVTPNSLGNYMYEFSDLIENVARTKCNVSTINMYKELDINSNNYKEYLSDEVHPNEKLKNIIADVIIDKVNKI